MVAELLKELNSSRFISEFVITLAHLKPHYTITVFDTGSLNRLRASTLQRSVLTDSSTAVFIIIIAALSPKPSLYMVSPSKLSYVFLIILKIFIDSRNYKDSDDVNQWKPRIIFPEIWLLGSEIIDSPFPVPMLRMGGYIPPLPHKISWLGLHNFSGIMY